MKITLSREYRAYSILIVWMLIFSWIFVRHFGFVNYESIRSFLTSVSDWSLPSIIFFASSILFLRSLLYYGKSFFFGDALDSSERPASHQLVTNTLFAYGVSETAGYRQYMEDRFIVAGDVGRIPGVSVYGVFDGHGGHRASEYAAQNLVKYLAESPEELLHDPARVLFKSFLKTDAAFLRKGMTQDPPFDDGTTAVVALVLPWDGDSTTGTHSSTASRKSSIHVTNVNVSNTASLNTSESIELAASETPAATVKTPLPEASVTMNATPSQSPGSTTFSPPNTNPDSRVQDADNAKTSSDSSNRDFPPRSPYIHPPLAPSSAEAGLDSDDDTEVSPDNAKCMRISSRSVLVDSFRIMVANAGDSKAILVRANGAIEHLSFDHKPNRPDEVSRIRNLGGVVCFNGVWRVQGVLAVSRALGDRLLKPYVTCRPDIRTWVLRSPRNNSLRQTVRPKPLPSHDLSVNATDVQPVNAHSTASPASDPTSQCVRANPATSKGSSRGSNVLRIMDSAMTNSAITSEGEKAKQTDEVSNSPSITSPAIPNSPKAAASSDKNSPTLLSVPSSRASSTIPSRSSSDTPWHVAPMSHSPLVLVLATDGLWDVISADEVGEFVYNACMHPEELCSGFSGCMSSSRSNRSNRRHSTPHPNTLGENIRTNDHARTSATPSTARSSGRPTSHSDTHLAPTSGTTENRQRSVYTPLRPAVSSTWKSEAGALMQEVSAQLMRKALELGSKDNITVLCVDLRAPSRVIPAHADRFVAKSSYQVLQKKNTTADK